LGDEKQLNTTGHAVTQIAQFYVQPTV